MLAEQREEVTETRGAKPGGDLWLISTQILELRRVNPRMSWREIWERIPNHYSCPRSFHMAMLQFWQRQEAYSGLRQVLQAGQNEPGVVECGCGVIFRQTIASSGCPRGCKQSLRRIADYRTEEEAND